MEEGNSPPQTIEGVRRIPPQHFPRKNLKSFLGKGGDPSLRSGRHFASVQKGDFCPFPLFVTPSRSCDGSPPYPVTPNEVRGLLFLMEEGKVPSSNSTQKQILITHLLLTNFLKSYILCLYLKR